MKTKRRLPKINSKGIYVPYESELCISFYYKYLFLKAYNQLPYVKVIKIANESISSPGYRNKMVKMGLTKGAPDYQVTYMGGRTAFIEFKRTAKDKLKPEQQKFKEEVEALGCIHIVPYTVEEGINLLFKLNSL